MKTGILKVVQIVHFVNFDINLLLICYNCPKYHTFAAEVHCWISFELSLFVATTEQRYLKKNKCKMIISTATDLPLNQYPGESVHLNMSKNQTAEYRFAHHMATFLDWCHKTQRIEQVVPTVHIHQSSQYSVCCHSGLLNYPVHCQYTIKS